MQENTIAIGEVLARNRKKHKRGGKKKGWEPKSGPRRSRGHWEDWGNQTHSIQSKGEATEEDVGKHLGKATLREQVPVIPLDRDGWRRWEGQGSQPLGREVAPGKNGEVRDRKALRGPPHVSQTSKRSQKSQWGYPEVGGITREKEAVKTLPGVFTTGMTFSRRQNNGSSGG